MTKDFASEFLQNFAQAATDDSLFKEQAAAIKTAISNATSHEEVEEELKKLHGFDHRVPDLALEIVQLVFAQAKTKPFEAKTYLYKRYKIDARSSAFPILTRLVYQMPHKVIPMLWEYLNCETPKIAEEAKEAIKEVTEYDREVLPHVGISVQQEVALFLGSLPKDDLTQHIETVVTLCAKILSLETQGTRFTSADTLVFTRGALSASKELSELRSTIITLLKMLYETIADKAKKRRVVGTLHSITRHPYRLEKPTEAILNLINTEVGGLLAFYEQIIPSADNETLQKIGHDLYWMHYHHGHEYNEPNLKKIIALRDKLYANEELNVFNALVGFEAVFAFEWEKKNSAEDSVKLEQDFRNGKVVEYLKAINSDNYLVWQKRILNYAQIESNDGATFIYLGQFLRELGKQHPAFAKELLAKKSVELNGFRTALIEGLLESDNEAATGILEDWLSKSIYLQSISYALDHTKTAQLALYEKLLAKAVEQKDQVILNLLVGALIERYSKDENTIPLIISAIKELTNYKDARWVNVAWWRKKLDLIADQLSDSDIDVILESLVYVPSIGTHEEWALAPIAKKNPVKVMAFFKARILAKDMGEHDDEDGDRYEAIPYRFYEKLSASFRAHLEQIVPIAVDWMKNDEREQRRKAARLLHAITDDRFDELRDILITLYKNKAVSAGVVIEILHEYAGILETQAVWKVLIADSPSEDLKNDCIGYFFGTGTTSGADGVALAYDERYKMFTEWQSDNSEEVKQVGIEGAKAFKSSAKKERARVEEMQQLRDYDFKNQS